MVEETSTRVQLRTFLFNIQLSIASGGFNKKRHEAVLPKTRLENSICFEVFAKN